MNDTQNIWLVVKLLDPLDNTRYEIQGVFDRESLAISACKGDCWSVMPLILNKEYPEETAICEESYFPCLTNK